jgi:glycosyltransferase involved in cell wall biosynthesis
MTEALSKKILIMSTCYIDWGGSEELWAKSVPYLQNSGFRIIVYKRYINRLHKEFADLAGKGVILTDHSSTSGRAARLADKGWRIARSVYAKLKGLPLRDDEDKSFARNLEDFRPSLVVISQGINFDGLRYAYQCLLRNIPYVIVCQKAVDFYWPNSTDRDYMTRALLHARKCFFVSKHNYRLTEEQFGVRLPNGEVVFNPVKLPRHGIPYPPADRGYKLACVARLFLLDKGQDILLRILAEDKWKDRPVKVSFIGSGDDLEGLRAMARLLNVNNIDFTGQVSNMEEIWREHHALILPSRSEGLALSVVEAMAAGRPVIVTDAGGNAELVEEGVTGFIGKADRESLANAMERAWNSRNIWESMGHAASRFVAGAIPKEPEFEFANLLNKVVND